MQLNDQGLLAALAEMDNQFRNGSRLHKLAVIIWAQDHLPPDYLWFFARRLTAIKDQFQLDDQLLIAGLQHQASHGQGVGATAPTKKTAPSATKEALGVVDALKKLGFNIANEVQLHELRHKCTVDPTLWASPICKALAAALTGTKLPTIPTVKPGTTVTTGGTTTTKKDAGMGGMGMYLILAVAALLLLTNMPQGGQVRRR